MSTSLQKAPRVRAVLVVCCVLLLLCAGPGGQVAGAGVWLPGFTSIVLRGGSNSILGFYAAGGLGFAVGPGYTLVLGITYTERSGYEPLITLSRVAPVGSGWTLAATASRGDFGGDYRVDRLPEITFTRSGPLAGAILHYGLEAGAGYFVVQPNNLGGARGTVSVSLSTSPFRPTGTATLSASTGYRQYAYGSGEAHGAWWGSASLSLTPTPSLATTFTYLRQTPSGSSPLLFDAMGEENYVAGSANLRLSENLSLQHSQTYSFITNAISGRVYGISLTVAGGHTFTVSWDDIAQKLSASYGYRR